MGTPGNGCVGCVLTFLEAVINALLTLAANLASGIGIIAAAGTFTTSLTAAVTALVTCVGTTGSTACVGCVATLSVSVLAAITAFNNAVIAGSNPLTALTTLLGAILNAIEDLLDCVLGPEAAAAQRQQLQSQINQIIANLNNQ